MSERRPDETIPVTAEATPPTAGVNLRSPQELADSQPTIAGFEALLDRLPEGSLIAGRYRIGAILGFGGMGAVYRAHDQLLDVDVALKVLRREIAGDAGFLQRFRNELLTARSVTHRHVVRIHDLGVHEGMPFMTMDLIAGRSLREVLLAERVVGVERSVQIVRQVAEALREAHRQGVVHRDLKPGNILLDEAGEVYVTDFGVARSLDRQGLTRTGEVLGTPDYLAPEQARGEKVDGRSDLYALGLIWFEMLSGERPFHGGSLLEVIAQHMSGRTRTLRDVGVAVPAPVDAVLRRCLAPDPKDRYADTGELIADLDDLRRPARRRLRQRAEIAAVVVLALVAAAVLWRNVPALWRTLRPPSEGAPAVAAAPRVHGIAVLPFASDAAAAQQGWSADGLAELLAGALQESPAVRVVPPARVAQVLDDLGFSSGNLDPRALVRLGTLLQADRLVTGSLRPLGDRLQLTASLHEVAADRAMPQPLPVLTGGAGELFVLTERLGEELRRRLEVGAPAAARRIASASAEAMLAYKEGLALLARDEPKAAAPALLRATAIDPGFAAAWLQLSRADQRLGLDEEALRAAQRATAAARPAGGRVLFEAQAQEALLRDHPEAAQKALAALVAAYPNDLGARVALAEAYGDQGSYDRAIAVLEEVTARDPKDPRAWFLLGRFALRAGDAQRAANTYLRQALMLQIELGDHAGEAEVLNALGVAYDRLGKTVEAVRQYRDAAELREKLGDRSGLADTLHNLGWVLLAQGDLAGAEAAFARALSILRELRDRPRIAILENTFGGLEEERGRYAEALERYKQALQLRSELGDEAALAESHNNVGYVYFLLGDYDTSRLYLERAFALYEKHGNRRGALMVLQSRGACELAQGQWQEALATLHDSLDRSRQLDLKAATAVAHGSLARLAYFEGRYTAAVIGYAAARRIVDQLEDRRGQAEFALGEAETLIELGALDEAGKRLAEVEAWRREGLSKEHEAQLAILTGRLALRRGDRGAALRSFAAGADAAKASHSPPLAIEARLGAASATARPSSSDLRGALDQARGLGHAALELAAAEQLAAAELAGGRGQKAEEVLRTAMERVRATGSWRRSYVLRRLLADAYEKRGARSEAETERAEARAELARIVQDAPASLRAGFEAQQR
jgi:tetratricopeptide (TPR) repeat protein